MWEFSNYAGILASKKNVKSQELGTDRSTGYLEDTSSYPHITS